MVVRLSFKRIQGKQQYLLLLVNTSDVFVGQNGGQLFLKLILLRGVENELVPVLKDLHEVFEASESDLWRL